MLARRPIAVVTVRVSDVHRPKNGVDGSVEQRALSNTASGSPILAAIDAAIRAVSHDAPSPEPRRHGTRAVLGSRSRTSQSSLTSRRHSAGEPIRRFTVATARPPRPISLARKPQTGNAAPFDSRPPFVPWTGLAAMAQRSASLLSSFSAPGRGGRRDPALSWLRSESCDRGVAQNVTKRGRVHCVR